MLAFNLIICAAVFAIIIAFSNGTVRFDKCAKPLFLFTAALMGGMIWTLIFYTEEETTFICEKPSYECKFYQSPLGNMHPKLVHSFHITTLKAIALKKSVKTRGKNYSIHYGLVLKTENGNIDFPDMFNSKKQAVQVAEDIANFMQTNEKKYKFTKMIDFSWHKSNVAYAVPFLIMLTFISLLTQFVQDTSKRKKKSYYIPPTFDEEEIDEIELDKSKNQDKRYHIRPDDIDDNDYKTYE